MTRIGKVRLKLEDTGPPLHRQVLQFVTENGKLRLAEFRYHGMIHSMLPGGAWSHTHVEYRRAA